MVVKTSKDTVMVDAANGSQNMYYVLCYIYIYIVNVVNIHKF